MTWDGDAAPGWARRLEGAESFDLIRAAGAAAGIRDHYVLFGLLIAPSFILIGVPLLRASQAVGRSTAVLAWSTLLGAPASLMSYGGVGLGDPWDLFWGAEIPLLLAVCVCGAVAGVLAYRRHRVPVWWAALLAATPVVIVAGTAVFSYFPHGSLVGYGVEVAALAVGVRSATVSTGEPASSHGVAGSR
ncbi:hypothetical protein [Cellulomonas aerilata]|uniref:hypothetical protein n=1 Tax=Cellulomonas aerilata TaxID=515326 RepID=UPI0011BF3D39|nr:hypothetical protein [Cellulomonas aerilata]